MEKGTPVYAASFIRKREIVLEQELFFDELALRLILIHEIFHFVWPRLSNKLRSEFASLLQTELLQRARGELGESAAVFKRALDRQSAGWKNYVCESFCDTAAWCFSGIEQHETFRLAKRWRQRRAAFFRKAFEGYYKERCS